METGRVITLKQVWTLGIHLGSGGFGRVYQATDRVGAQVAVKLVEKKLCGDRELLIANDVTGVRNVIEVLDSGEDGNDYVLVMPLADRSLAQEMASRGGPMPASDAVAVLTDVAEALAGIAVRSIVSRDIKPNNVLLVAGTWQLCDFGIARYADATTGLATFKESGTAEYTSPERWQGKRATAAADVYSFGVMAYEMLAGRLPFNGPGLGDQHMHASPPPMNGIAPRLVSLVTECLYKRPEARPTAANILARLHTILNPASGGAAVLHEANRSVVDESAKAEAKLAAVRTEKEVRDALYAISQHSLHDVIDMLDAAIAEAAPNSSRTNATTATGWTRSLGKAMIYTFAVQPANVANFGDRRPPFDLVSYASIGVRIPEDRSGYAGRSHSLWFSDANEKGVYRWYETAFVESPVGLSAVAKMNPFALPPGPEAGAALEPSISGYQVAWPFLPFDQGDEAGLIERWLTWFGLAAQGALSRPSSMPERADAHNSWRK